MGIIRWISEKVLQHATRGDFEYKKRKPAKMKSGGHGEKKLHYLKRHRFSYGIDTEYTNGLRKGHIDNHKRRFDRAKNGHTWFPDSWDSRDIKKAGLYVANLKRNKARKNNVLYEGRYKGVSVGIYFRNGKIASIFPLHDENKHARRKTYVKHRK